jgi:hypothetical protein
MADSNPDLANPTEAAGNAGTPAPPAAAETGTPTPTAPDASVPPRDWRSVLRSSLHKPRTYLIGLPSLALTAVITGFFMQIGVHVSDQVTTESSAAPATAQARVDPRGFTVAVNEHYRAGQTYALSAPLTSGPQVAALLAGFTDRQHDMQSYLATNAGAPVGAFDAEIVFTGTRSDTVRIVQMRVQVIGTAPNLSGTQILTSSGGQSDTIPVTVDLDRPTPEVIAANGKPYFDGRDIDVSENVHETFQASFTVTKYLCRWIFAVDYIDPTGTRQSVYFDALGHLYPKATDIAVRDAFALTGKAPGYTVTYQDNYPAGSGFHLKK